MPAPKGNDFAVGNAGGGAPLGNTNAIGNAGGGPPAGNGNAVKHGGWSDPAKRFDRLDAGERERVAYWFRIYYDRFTRVYGVAPSATTDARVAETMLDLDASAGADVSVSARLHRLAVLRDQRIAVEGEGWTGDLSAEKEREFETADGETVTATVMGVKPAINAGWELRARIEHEEEALGIGTGALTRSVEREDEGEEEDADGEDGAGTASERVRTRRGARTHVAHRRRWD